MIPLFLLSFSCFAHANGVVELTRKAELGDVNSQYELGIMYQKGEGIPQNYKNAYIWFSLAAAKGHNEAIKKRNIIEEKLTREQLGKAQDLAVSKQVFIDSLINYKEKPLPDQKSVNGRFVTNSNAGTLFVITGRVDNPSNITYSYTQIKGTLVTNGKQNTKTKDVYCGNIISEEMLKSGNMADINKLLIVREGSDNKNVSLLPGSSIPFMVVFENLPEKLQNFTVKVIHSEKEKVKELPLSKMNDKSGTNSDNEKKKYKAIDLYNLVIGSAIEQNWIFNDILAKMDQDLEVRILIKILKSGEIRDIIYETKSGNRYLDESAKKAVKKANPLPRLPAGLHSYDVGLIFTPKGLQLL